MGQISIVIATQLYTHRIHKKAIILRTVEKENPHAMDEKNKTTDTMDAVEVVHRKVDQEVMVAMPIEIINKEVKVQREEETAAKLAAVAAEAIAAAEVPEIIAEVHQEGVRGDVGPEVEVWTGIEDAIEEDENVDEV